MANGGSNVIFDFFGGVLDFIADLTASVISYVDKRYEYTGTPGKETSRAVWAFLSRKDVNTPEKLFNCSILARDVRFIAKSGPYVMVALVTDDPLSIRQITFRTNGEYSLGDLGELSHENLVMFLAPGVTFDLSESEDGMPFPSDTVKIYETILRHRSLAADRSPSPKEALIMGLSNED